MLLHPWLLYYRRRLAAAAILSVLFTCLAHLLVSGEGFHDVGIFWHGFCGCPVDPIDAYFLLNLPPLVALSVGLVFGFMAPGASAPSGAAATAGVPGGQLKALSRFFFTRPISRRSTFFVPQAIAMTAIAVLPAASFLLLVGWLRLVHAPSLHHLMAVISTIPPVTNFGEHPTLVQVFSNISAPRRYLAAVSVGFCAYNILFSHQCLLLSPSKKLNVLAFIPVFLLFAPMWRIIGRHTADIAFLAPGRGTPLTYMPSILGIALHLGVAALISFGCWRIVRSVEL